ncbi:hypothetical protein TNCV_3458291 [Trichonephila clavipes]|nr:hypothetical protein TNCV_3458291 [Trichonephila clavipes]
MTLQRNPALLAFARQQDVKPEELSWNACSTPSAKFTRPCTIRFRPILIITKFLYNEQFFDPGKKLDSEKVFAEMPQKFLKDEIFTLSKRLRKVIEQNVTYGT